MGVCQKGQVGAKQIAFSGTHNCKCSPGILVSLLGRTQTCGVIGLSLALASEDHTLVEAWVGPGTVAGSNVLRLVWRLLLAGGR